MPAEGRPTESMMIETADYARARRLCPNGEGWLVDWQEYREYGNV